ncbi:histidine kinase [Streptosporangium sp. NPDC002524]|uniref:sensor histidine kinase n=1 Tax=Streptosporangium sp. NPDC002524 TaxID=3154537 RepID=UPI003329C70B
MRWWIQATARLGIRTPQGRDTAVAVVLAVLSLARLLLVFVSGEARAALAALPVWAIGCGYLLATADLATIAVRRRWPGAALVVAMVIPLVGAVLPTRPPLLGVGVVVCAYTVASLLPPPRATLIVAVSCVAHLLGGLAIVAAGGDVGGLLTFWGVTHMDGPAMTAAVVAAYSAPAVAGFHIQARRAGAARTAARIEREREERARAAVLEERARIARELHDIAAHDLSAIVVQAGAADRQLDRDPEAARETLRAIRAQGRETLTALRALVGLMRENGTEPDTGDGRVPALARMEEIVRRSRASGMTVETHTRGEPRPLPLTADLAASRLLQEALTNARRHAPGAAVTVVTVFEDRAVRVTVRNAAPPRPPDGKNSAGLASGGILALGGGALGGGADGGYGLVGMRERVRHAGGSLIVGPHPDGGWQVAADFPADS